MPWHSRPIEIRFWEKVDVKGPNDCWIWKGAGNIHGYGQILYNNKMTMAHRVAYMLVKGEIPVGFEVMHDCPGGDNRKCCNPAHLNTGTHAENIHDRVIKGPSPKPKGLMLVRAKLNEQETDLIITLFSEGQDIRSLAAQFKVTLASIKRIIRSKAA